MTVQAIRLQNFMAFADTGWIELRPITLLFGHNSSGKSAIIRALRLLRQSLDMSEDDSPLCFVSEHGVDLGGFKTVIHGQDASQRMGFYFQVYIPEVLDNIRSSVNQSRNEKGLPPITAQDPSNKITFSLIFDWDDAREQTELSELQINCPWPIGDEEDQNRLLFVQRLDLETARELDYEWWFDSDLSSLRRLDWTFASVRMTKGFLPMLEGFQEDNEGIPLVVSSILRQLRQSIETFLSNFEYLGPLRPEPYRVYVLDEPTRFAWQQRGWGAFLDFLENKIDATKLVEIDNWLSYLSLAQEVVDPKKVYPNEGELDEDKISIAKIRLIENKDKSDLKVNLKDVGFGTVQVLPIIVQSIAARQRAVPEEKADSEEHWVIVEQPELHLHPNAQARLANLFVDTVYATTSYNADVSERSELNYSGVNFLLETHSENLLLRLQRQLAETALQTKNRSPYSQPLFPSDFIAYFIERSKETGDSTCQVIKFNEWGEFVNPPEGFIEFFGEAFSQILGISEARAEWEEMRSINDTAL